MQEVLSKNHIVGLNDVCVSHKNAGTEYSIKTSVSTESTTMMHITMRSIEVNITVEFWPEVLNNSI